MARAVAFEALLGAARVRVGGVAGGVAGAGGGDAARVSGADVCAVAEAA